MFYRSTQAYRSLDALRVSTCDDSAKRLSQPELLGAESRAGSSRTSSPLSRIYATGSRLAHRLSLSPSLRRRRDAQGDATSARAFTPIRRKRLSLSSDWTSHARAVFDWHAILSVVVSDHHHAQQSAPRKALVVGDPSPMWILHQAQRTGWEETRFHGITFEKQWLFTSHLPPELSGRIRLGRIEHDMQLSLELQSFDYALFFKPLNIDPKTSNAVGQNITNALKCGATFEIVHGPILAQEASANSAKPRKLAAQPALTGAKSMSSWTAEDLLAGSLKPEDENLLEVIWQRTTIARQHETERRLPAFASRNESTEHLSDQLAAAMQRSFDWFVSPTPPPQTPSSMSLHDFEAELKPSMSKLKKARKRLSSFGSLGMSREILGLDCSYNC
ncbi:uncharacterized protein L969DRAFT_91874 [Mixia osmundae IAM 14324]|uniref:Uncharacterized protein n=1 Tax=Mixia osmundae (strain CBS 9802 / IAM 14324 / JCM 22182 / KY 12970) TaxID=764103 RepID=G7E2T4_MIXOS|nr:uncharacterized protein L969DRAFT_91874 [Mixia osmundae IAM 14324]KEI42433.1 hypothetical protein L969DRAFT_91874 [Mixia osmundae IAM 14324]GAA97278.1 hypothetical protein E5Q_03955 [Mixia osmundae IAM 14324]